MVKLMYNSEQHARISVVGQIARWIALLLLLLIASLLASILRAPPNRGGLCIWASQSRYWQLIGFANEICICVEEPRAGPLPPQAGQQNETPYRTAVRSYQLRLGIVRLWIGDADINRHSRVFLLAMPKWIPLLLCILAGLICVVRWRRKLW
jgi:hypothetical protein